MAESNSTYDEDNNDGLNGLMQRLAELETQLEAVLSGASPTPFPILVNVEDARLMLGRASRATIYRMIEKGQLESVKVGGRRLITIASMRSVLRRAGLRSA